MFKIVLAITLLTVCAQAASARDDTLRIRALAEPELESFMEIGNRQFKINRIAKGKLGNRVLSGDTLDGDTMTIVQSEQGFAGSVLIDNKSYQVMPDGSLRRAGRIKKNDVVVRPDDPNLAYDRMTAGDDVGIVDRWNPPGWQNMIKDFNNNYYGFWGYTEESNRSITYVDVFAYVDNKIGNQKAFLDAEFALANKYLERSKVYIRLNLVGYKGIDLPVEKATNTLYNMGNGHAQFRNIRADQAQSGADLVTTFASTDTRRDMCGVAFIGGYKGRWDYRDGRSVIVCHGGETFVHEIAHNFGSDHDDANAGSGFHFWYSLGFNKRNQQGFDHISTIMSYGNAEVGVFSNPDLYCKGEACGREETSDNARSLNETRRWVAAYNGAGSCVSNCGYGSASDDDKDNDGIDDRWDACPNTPPNTEVDTSGCPVYTGPGVDDEGDGGDDDGGNDSATDSDNDGINDSDDNCPDVYNPSQKDSDNDGIGDLCDSTPTGDNDRDNDGVSDNKDNCPTDYNPSQADNDGDGLGNACDSTPNGDPTPTMSTLMDVSTHGSICDRSRSTNRDFKNTYRGFENNSTSGSVWAVCPITRGNNTSMVAAEITILPVTDSAGNYNIQCDLVEIYEGNVEEVISISVNPQQTNTGESTHVFNPVEARDKFSSAFAIECQVPRGYAITNVRQASGNN